jgi:hypothetical protein
MRLFFRHYLTRPPRCRTAGPPQRRLQDTDTALINVRLLNSGPACVGFSGTDGFRPLSDRGRLPFQVTSRPRATISFPERTDSRIPYGSSITWSALSLSLVPVASNVIASRLISTE